MILCILNKECPWHIMDKAAVYGDCVMQSIQHDAFWNTDCLQVRYKFFKKIIQTLLLFLAAIQFN